MTHGQFCKFVREMARDSPPILADWFEDHLCVDCEWKADLVESLRRDTLTVEVTLLTNHYGAKIIALGNTYVNHWRWEDHVVVRTSFGQLSRGGLKVKLDRNRYLYPSQAHTVRAGHLALEGYCLGAAARWVFHPVTFYMDRGGLLNPALFALVWLCYGWRKSRVTNLLYRSYEEGP